jgi:hypothetical protein
MGKDHLVLYFAHISRNFPKVNKNQYPAFEYKIKQISVSINQRDGPGLS